MQDRDDQNKNQTGQQSQQSTDKDKPGFGQQGQQGQSTDQTGSDKGAFGDAGGDTTLTQGQKSQFDKAKQRPDEPGGESFVGSSKEADTSEAYLSEGETAQTDFAEQGQGATERNDDIETGTAARRDASLDDGS